MALSDDRAILFIGLEIPPVEADLSTGGCSGVPGAWSSDPSLPTGDGEAMSHSAPLEHPSFFVFSGSSEIVIQGLSPTAADDPTYVAPSDSLRVCNGGYWSCTDPDGPGDGEHLSLPSPVGRLPLGPLGPRGYFPRARCHQLRARFGSAGVVALVKIACSSVIWRSFSATACSRLAIWCCRASTRSSWLPCSSVSPAGKLIAHLPSSSTPWIVRAFSRRLTVSVDTPSRDAASAMPMLPVFCCITNSVSGAGRSLRILPRWCVPSGMQGVGNLAGAAGCSCAAKGLYDDQRALISWVHASKSVLGVNPPW